MKSIKPLTFILGSVILICLSSDAQDTNKIEAARKEASQVRPCVLKIDYGYGPAVFSDQPTLYLVQLPVATGKISEEHSEPDVDSFGLQVWLLKTDGTSIPQRGKPNMVGIGNAGWYTDSMIYTFDKVPANELAGIVLRVKGKLYCQEIETKVP